MEHLIQSLPKALGALPVDLDSGLLQAGAGFDGLGERHRRHNGILAALESPGSCTETLKPSQIKAGGALVVVRWRLKGHRLSSDCSYPREPRGRLRRRREPGVVGVIP